MFSFSSESESPMKFEYNIFWSTCVVRLIWLASEIRSDPLWKKTVDH